MPFLPQEQIAINTILLFDRVGINLDYQKIGGRRRESPRNTTSRQ